MVADIKFPRQYGEDVDINMVISEILENLNNTFAPGRYESIHPDDELIPGQPVLSGPAILAPVTAVGPVAERARQQRAEHDEAARQRQRPRIGPPVAADEVSESDRDWHLSMNEVGDAPGIPPSVVIELDIRFKDIKASMPIFTRALSYSTYALARPIVAFMNANKTLIPVNCRVVMDLVRSMRLTQQSEFDGSLDLSQTGLPPLVSDKVRGLFLHRSGRPWRTMWRHSRRTTNGCAMSACGH